MTCDQKPTLDSNPGVCGYTEEPECPLWLPVWRQTTTSTSNYLRQVRTGGLWNFCPNVVKLPARQVILYQNQTIMHMQSHCHSHPFPNESACAEVTWGVQLRYSCRSGSTVLFWYSFCVKLHLCFCLLRPLLSLNTIANFHENSQFHGNHFFISLGWIPCPYIGSVDVLGQGANFYY